MALLAQKYFLTNTHVQILTACDAGTHFTSFTGTTVQILTQQLLQSCRTVGRNMKTMTAIFTTTTERVSTTELNMCVYICIYVCMRACVCMHICMYVCMHACMHVYMYIRMFVYIYTHINCIYIYILPPPRGRVGSGGQSPVACLWISQ